MKKIRPFVIVELLQMSNERVVVLPECVLALIGVEDGATLMHPAADNQAVVLRAAVPPRSGWAEAAARIGTAGLTESSGRGE